MPTCRRCGIAYLESESHHCAPRRMVASLVGAGLGAIVGAVCGAALALVVYGLATGTTIAGVVIIGAMPAGAVIGAVVGSRRI